MGLTELLKTKDVVKVQFKVRPLAKKPYRAKLTYVNDKLETESRKYSKSSIMFLIKAVTDDLYQEDLAQKTPVFSYKMSQKKENMYKLFLHMSTNSSNYESKQ